MVVYFPDLTPWHGIAAMGEPVFDDPPPPARPPRVRVAELDTGTVNDALPAYAAAVTQGADSQAPAPYAGSVTQDPDIQALSQAEFDNRFAPAADQWPSQTLLDPSRPWATGGTPGEPPAAAGIAQDPNAPQTMQQRFNEDFEAPWQTEDSRALERFRESGSAPLPAAPAGSGGAPPPANIAANDGARATTLSPQNREMARIAQHPDAQRVGQYYNEEAKQWLDRFGITDPHVRNVLIERGLIAIGDNARRAEPEVKNGILSVPGLPIRNVLIPGYISGQSATRRAQPFSAIVSHWTAGPDLDSALRERRVGDRRAYHFYIDWDGTVYQGASLDTRTNHVLPPGDGQRTARPDISNRNAIGISVVGDRNNPTLRQKESAKTLTEALMSHYGIPLSNVVGHGEIQKKQRDEGKALLDALRTTPTGTPADVLPPNAPAPGETIDDWVKRTTAPRQ